MDQNSPIQNVLKSITWLGHDSFFISGKKISIVFDPFQLKNDAPKADIILVSHPHYDHCSVDDIKKVVKKDSVIVTEKESADLIKGKINAEIKTAAPNESVTVKQVIIETVPAYNVNKKFHPKEKNWLGFIITIENVRIYHSGDTDLIPEMKDFNVDIALLPVSGTYVMTADEAVKAAKIIKPAVAIPMHYNAIVGTTDDARTFESGIKDDIKVILL